MGTRGYVVYRHKGHYFFYFNQYDSYPSGLGVELAAAVPIDPEEFKEWLNARRAHFQLILEEWQSCGGWEDTNMSRMRYTDQVKPYVSRRQPRTDWTIDFVYEIDLDWNAFHINNSPVYRLDDMPSPEHFCAYMNNRTFDRYMIQPDAPQKHRYQWKVDPPIVDNELLITYEQHKSGSHLLSVNDILCPAGSANANLVTVRQKLCEAFIIELMVNSIAARLIFELERIPDAKSLPKDTLVLANAILHLFTAPMVYGKDALVIPDAASADLLWARDDMCTLLGTHLDDEDNLHSTIAKLFTAVTKRVDRPPFVYGIVFSIFHCAIVRIDSADDENKLFHTPALQFLPAWLTEHTPTPGITALVKLCCLVDPSVINKVASVVCTHVEEEKKQIIPSRKGTSWEKVPPEIAFEIGKHLHDAEDIIHFAGMSRVTANVATDLHRIPRLDGLELLAKEHESITDFRKFQAFDKNGTFLSTVNVRLEVDIQGGDEDENDDLCFKVSHL